MMKPFIQHTLVRIFSLAIGIFTLVPQATAQTEYEAPDSIFFCLYDLHERGKFVGYPLSEIDTIYIDSKLDYKTEKIGKYNAIDLGLSVRWADMNLDGLSETSYGGYYAWGETEWKDTFTDDNYKYNNGSGTFTNIGYEISGTDYDAAHVKMGNEWRLPSEDEFGELNSMCELTENQKYYTPSGKDVRGPNGNVIYIPYTGVYFEDGNTWRDKNGYYWTSDAMRKKVEGNLARGYVFQKNSRAYSTQLGKNRGATIRAVCPLKKIDDEMLIVHFTNGDTLRYKIDLIDSITFRRPSQVIERLEAVDLGLSVKWANMNVGAINTKDIGEYFAWGELERKKFYIKNTYKYYKNGDYQSIGTDISGTEYDVAHTTLGGNWRMPTVKEAEELCSKCKFSSIVYNGKLFTKVTGPNGASIILPVTGLKFSGFLGGDTFWSLTWTSAVDPDDPNESIVLGAYNEGIKTKKTRSLGLPVRAVCK